MARAKAGSGSTERESNITADTRLHVRDCYTQIRSVRRLLAQLVDELGDVTMCLRDERRGGGGSGVKDLEPERRVVDAALDAVTEFEDRLQKAQEGLQALSHGRVTP